MQRVSAGQTSSRVVDDGDDDGDDDDDDDEMKIAERCLQHTLPA
jgi:hypothetical protein